MKIGLVGAGRIGAFHARTLDRLPAVRTLLIADTDPAYARTLADELKKAAAVDTVDELFAAGPDAVVVAASTAAHAPLVRRALRAGLPVFCEKPVAPDVAGTIEIMEEARRSGVPVQVGFQRRFDAGHVAARAAVVSGRLGWIHTLRSCTLDPAPPPPGYLPQSGGIFRDCAIHDIDGIRYVTGQEIVEVAAVGANRGEPYFAESGDVDTASAVLRLADGSLATVSATRYNSAGYDARLEVLGATGDVTAGLDERTPLVSVPERAEAGQSTPYGGFLDRFADAYAAELAAFTEVVAGRLDNPCTPRDALAALLVADACEQSRREGRTVQVQEVSSR